MRIKSILAYYCYCLAVIVIPLVGASSSSNLLHPKSILQKKSPPCVNSALSMRGGTLPVITASSILKVRGYYGLFEGLILLADAVGMSPPILGLQESVEGYVLTEVMSDILIMKAQTLIPISIIEILNSDNDSVQRVFLAYHFFKFVTTFRMATRSNSKGLQRWVRPASYALFGGSVLLSMIKANPEMSKSIL